MESNKVKGLIFPVGGEAQAFLADRDRPYRDIREAVQGEYDELGATFADVDILSLSTLTERSSGTIPIS